MSGNSFDRATSRKAVLSMTLEDVLAELKDAIDLASRSGDICHTVYFADKINLIENLIDNFITVDEDTDGLITEEYGQTEEN